MRELGRMGWAVFAVNSAGFAGYLLWLVTGARRILYTQDGVLYLLPCLPFFFVYVFLFRKTAGAADAGPED